MYEYEENRYSSKFDLPRDMAVTAKIHVSKSLAVE